MSGSKGIDKLDGVAAYVGGGLLGVAAGWSFMALAAGSATEKEKGACAVLALAGVVMMASAIVARFSRNVAFILRTPVLIASYAMAGIVPVGGRYVVYAALVPVAVAIVTVVLRLLDDMQSKPVSHL